MTNQEQYELICEKEKKYDRLVEVLEKITAEIEEKRPLLYPFVDHKDEYLKRKDVLQIIDKYRKEQEC